MTAEHWRHRRHTVVWLYGSWLLIPSNPWWPGGRDHSICQQHQRERQSTTVWETHRARLVLRHRSWRVCSHPTQYYFNHSPIISCNRMKWKLEPKVSILCTASIALQNHQWDKPRETWRDPDLAIPQCACAYDGDFSWECVTHAVAKGTVRVLSGKYNASFCSTTSSFIIRAGIGFVYFLLIMFSAVYGCKLSLMCGEWSCLPLSFLCVLKSPLLQTVWGAELDGLGRGGGKQRTWRQARINWQCNEMAWCQVTMELPSFPVY